MQPADSVSLSGSVAVVTGGVRGIGHAIVNQLALMKATVVFTGRDEARVQPVARDLTSHGHRVEGVACDVTDLAGVEALGEHLRKSYGRVDILINNAGIGGPPGCLLHELAPADWEAIFNTNLRGPYLMIRAFAPLMIAAGYGHIINISSLAGRNSLPKGAAYAASKWGLNGLTYSVAEELRQYNIRVSVIAPGSINTGFNDHSGRGAASGKDPNKKLQPDQIASVVAALVTQPAQSFISEVLIRPTQKP